MFELAIFLLKTLTVMLESSVLCPIHISTVPKPLLDTSKGCGGSQFLFYESREYQSLLVIRPISNDGESGLVLLTSPVI
jgi:hypothetical protein